MHQIRLSTAALLAVLVALCSIALPASAASPYRVEPEDFASCGERLLGEGQSLKDVLSTCTGVPVVEIVTVSAAQNDFECVIAAQTPYHWEPGILNDYSTPPTSNWGAFSICNQDALHSMAGTLDWREGGVTAQVGATASQNLTKFHSWRVETPCVTTPAGSYVATIIGEFKPVDVTALAYAAIDISPDGRLGC